MILPMKKVCLVVQDKHQDEALAKLRETGLVHIEMSKPSPEKFTALMERKTQAENAVNLIRQYKLPKMKPVPPPQLGGAWERRKVTGPHRGRRTADIMGVEEQEPYSVDAVNAPDRP